MTIEQKQEYASVVTEYLFERAGQPARIISPMEWHILRGWMEAEYPLRIVLRGMQDCSRAGRTLTYYGPAVREAIERWRVGLTA